VTPPLNIRVSGAWVESDATGAARLAGETIPFGPSGGGPTREVLTWTLPPAFTDLEDGGQNYNMGIRFQVTETLPCVGIQWRVPDSVLSPAGGNHQASIWDESPTRLASQNFTPATGDYQDILFSGAITLSPATNYIAAVYTRSYVFRASGGVYPSSPSGKVVADAGRLQAFNGGPDLLASAPLGVSAGLFYISPIVEV
jgi:hypothetical protein